MTAFGTVFMPEMVQVNYVNGQWSAPSWVSAEQLTLHPGAHVFHYASTCFEGLKAFRHPDGSVNIFRLDQNVARMAQSSRIIALPPIDETQLTQMIMDVTARFADQVPEPPGSMYIRPTHIGTEPSIGKAAAPSDTSLLYVLLSPVGDYFKGGQGALRLLLSTEGMRCAPHMGQVKSGGNYASALPATMAARAEMNADQVLFCPEGWVQETGAANFMIIDGQELITKSLDSTFLHGVTRHSVLQLAHDMGLSVQERELSVDELIERAAKPHSEAALSGTAAVLAPVGTLIHQGQEIQVGQGQPGPTTMALRKRMNDIQWGLAEDTHGWLTRVDN